MQINPSHLQGGHGLERCSAEADVATQHFREMPKEQPNTMGKREALWMALLLSAEPRGICDMLALAGCLLLQQLKSLHNRLSEGWDRETLSDFKGSSGCLWPILDVL